MRLPEHLRDRGLPSTVRSSDLITSFNQNSARPGRCGLRSRFTGHDNSGVYVFQATVSEPWEILKLLRLSFRLLVVSLGTAPRDIT